MPAYSAQRLRAQAPPAFSRGSGAADEARRCGLTLVSTTWLNEVAIADGGTSGMSAGGLGMSSSDALDVGLGGFTSLMAPRRR